MIKPKKLNKLTPTFESTPRIAIYIKGTLVKVKAESSALVVTIKTIHFCRILENADFPSSTSNESDDDFEYNRDDNNDNHNYNNKRYSLLNRQPPCQYGTALEHFRTLELF